MLGLWLAGMFHAENEQLTMSEDQCDKTTRKCNGYAPKANVFVYCHMLIWKLLKEENFPNSISKKLSIVFQKCSKFDEFQRIDIKSLYENDLKPLLNEKEFEICGELIMAEPSNGCELIKNEINGIKKAIIHKNYNNEFDFYYKKKKRSLKSIRFFFSVIQIFLWLILDIILIMVLIIMIELMRNKVKI